jgi:WD40 repeat protein
VRWIGSNIYYRFDHRLWRFDCETSFLRQVTAEDVETEYRMVDVRNDEEMIVYSATLDNQIDLWTADLNGTNPVRLTNTESRELSPKWSSRQGDGVVYVSNEGGLMEVWEVMLSDGVRRRLTTTAHDEESVHPSPDGSFIAIGGATEMANLRLLAPAERRVLQVTQDNRKEFWPSVSRSADRIAFQRSAPILESGYELFDAEVFLGALEARRLAGEPSLVAAGFAPHLSGDGNWLAYLRLSASQEREAGMLELHVLNTSTLSMFTLTDRLKLPNTYTFPLGLEANCMLWAPEQPIIYFVDYPESGFGQIQRADFSRGDEEPVVVHALGERDGTGKDLQLSSDGNRLAHVVFSQSRDTAELHVLDLSANEDAILYRSSGSDLLCKGWLDDSRTLIALQLEPSSEADGTSTVEIIGFDTSGSPSTLGRIENVYAGTTRLDTRTGTLYLVSIIEKVHGLYAYSLADGSLNLLLSNELPGTTYSGIQVLADGSLLYSEQFSSNDIWLARMER